MPPSSDRFAISLPVDPGDRWRLHAWVVFASLLSAGALTTFSAGAGRLIGLLPLAAGLASHCRLAGYAPLPDAAQWKPRSGWSLRTRCGAVPVVLCAGGWFGRSLALAAFRARGGGGGKRWLVPLRRPRHGGAQDWRRLRVLWRTRRATLVGN